MSIPYNRNKEKERNKNIDILKGIGMCLVVLGHAGFPFTHFIYLFHLALFFIASGFCYSSDYAEDLDKLKKFLKKRFLGLYKPYVLFSIFYILTWNILIRIHIYLPPYLSFFALVKKVIKTFFFLGNAGNLSGALWFLQCLFVIEIIYEVIEYVLKKMQIKNTLLIQLIISIISLLYSYFGKNEKIFGIVIVFSTYYLFLIGQILFVSGYTKNIKFIYMAGCISLPVLIICNYHGSVEITKRIITDPIFFIICSISGWFFVYFLSLLVSKNCILSKILCYIGRNTIPIIGLHFFCFKFVSLLQINIRGYSIEKLSAFPVIDASRYWWVVYTAAGIFLPLGINYIYNKCKMYVFIYCKKLNII